MSSLPAGWITAPLGAFTLDCGQRVPDEFEEFKYIDIGSVNRDTKRIETPQQLLGKDAPSRARKHVKAGDVLVSMTRPNLNAVALVPDELDGQIASTGFDVLRTSFGIEHRWVSYLVRTDAFVEAMSELVQGALYPAVRPRDIRGFEAPLAPSNEQKRIADKLDAVLARVDVCRDRLDRIPAILKRFRQSVLAAATSGKLTEDWRAEHVARMQPQAESGNIARDSAQSHYVVTIAPDSVTLHPGYEADSESWNEIPLDEACIKITDGEHISPSLTSSGIPLVSAKDVREWGVDFSDTKFVSAEFSSISRRRCNPELDDVLVVSRGATVGRTCLITSDREFCLMGSVLLFKSDIDKVNPRYLAAFLRSPLGLERLTGASGASAQSAIYIRDTKKLLISLPPKEEQTEIVRRVEALFIYADRLEARYAAARTQVEKLTPATLAKAFRGELAPQDPNDEPASALLERIRTQSDHQAASKPKRDRHVYGVVN